jgi:hypothetical protein
MKLPTTGGALAAGLFLLLATPTLAGPLEGSWGGADTQGRTAQITVVGDEIVGFFWIHDYQDTTGAHFSQGGAELQFAFDGGEADVTRAGAAAKVTVRTTSGQVLTIAVKKD